MFVSADGAVRASCHHRRHRRMSYSPSIGGGVPLRLASPINTSAIGSNDSNLCGTRLPARQSLIRCTLTSGARGYRCRCAAVALEATISNVGLPAQTNNDDNAWTNAARAVGSGAQPESFEIRSSPPHNTNVVNGNHVSVDSLRHGRAFHRRLRRNASRRPPRRTLSEESSFRSGIPTPQRKTRT